MSYVAFSLALFPRPSIQLCGRLECGEPPITVKASSLEAARESRKEMGLLQSFISREPSLFDLSGCSLDDPTCMAVSIWTDWLRACSFEVPFPWKHLSKTFKGNCLTLQLPQAVGNTWGEQ